MATTIIEVIDTAVKIGLSGAIAVVGTYYVTRMNHKHEQIKERSRRYFDTIEEVGGNIEEVTNSALRYWAIIKDWVRYYKEEQSMPEERSKRLDAARNSLFDNYRSMTVAESKLLLLGLEDSSLLLREYGEFIAQMRSNYAVGNQSLDLKQMESVRVELLSKRKVLFDSLAKHYKNDA